MFTKNRSKVEGWTPRLHFDSSTFALRRSSCNLGKASKKSQFFAWFRNWTFLKNPKWSDFFKKSFFKARMVLTFNYSLSAFFRTWYNVLLSQWFSMNWNAALGEPLLGAFALKKTEDYWALTAKVFSTTMCGSAEQKNPVAHLLTIFHNKTKENSMKTQISCIFSDAFYPQICYSKMLSKQDIHSF